MNIFISYASEDRNAAEHVHYALCNAGHGLADVLIGRR